MKKKKIIIISVVVSIIIIVAGAISILFVLNQRKNKKEQQELQAKTEKSVKDESSKKEEKVVDNGYLDNIDKEYINNAIKYECAGVSVYLPNGYILLKELQSGAQYGYVNNNNKFIYSLSDATKEESIAKKEYQDVLLKKYPKVSGPSVKIINDINYDIYQIPFSSNLDIYCAYGFKDKKFINCMYYNFKNEEFSIDDILKSLVIE